MTRNRHRLTRAAAERILDGLAHGAAPDRHHPVSELLAATLPCPFSGETPGEQAALAAFRATRDAAAITAAPRPRVARLVTLKLAAAAVVLAAGAVAAGVATHQTAAGTAAASPSPVPKPIAQGPLPLVTALPVPTSDSRTPPPAPSSTVPQPRATPLPPLCRALAGLPPGQQRKLLRTPPYAALVQAAGGVDNVADYCKTLPGDGNSIGHQDGHKVHPSHASGPHG
jgi:hypothetical protein